MKYKKSIISSGISKNDIINLKTSLSEEYCKYLVIKVDLDKKYLDLLPMDKMSEEPASNGIVPVMSMPFSLISKIKKDKDTSLFFFLNQENPHILNAIFTGK